MDDLISRKALIEKMNDTKVEIMFDLPVEELLGEDVDMDDFCTLLQDAIQAYRKLVIGEVINKISSVEAKPVVYGEWVYKKTYYEADECNCSLCGQLMTTHKGERMNFCPNCGADMRKKVQDGKVDWCYTIKNGSRLVTRKEPFKTNCNGNDA